MTTKKKSGSPAKNQSRVEGTTSRPKRVAVSGNRDILTVVGKDNEFKYRWVKDINESGQRVFKFRQAGYEFVDATTAEQYGIGSDSVYDASDLGSLIRKPAGDGTYLYLMRIPTEFFEEDQAAKQQAIKNTENQIMRERNPDSSGDDGQYGSVKFE